MAIPTNRAIVGSGKISLRSLMQLGFNSNVSPDEEESEHAHSLSELWKPADLPL
jgi:hypothetical protein